MSLDARIRALVLTIRADVAALKAAGGGQVPTRVTTSATYTVPADTQALFTIDIDVAGTLDIAGTLVEV